MAEYIDKAQVQTELMMSAERYTIAHESGGFGTVEWSDNLIPVSRAIEIIRNMPSIEDVPIIRCRECKYWQTDDGTFPDFDGRPWHECKCLYMFRAPDGEPARTTADFWCGYGERRKEE